MPFEFFPSYKFNLDNEATQVILFNFSVGARMTTNKTSGE